MTRLPFAVLVVLVFAVTTAAAGVGAVNSIVINEIYCDGAGEFDGSEFIELYNTHPDSAFDVQGWVLTGTEFDQGCGGEDLWQFPLGSPIEISAGGFLVVAKDGDESDSPDPDNDDSFYWEFGEWPNFEQYDSSPYFEHDSPFVANMVLLTPVGATNYSEEIQLVGGRGYGVVCSTPTSDSDVVYLYDNDPHSTANLVDLVEYVDPAECSTDPCGAHSIPPWPSDDGADDNAFQGVPYTGNSLGRDPSGTDTDMSINDWTLQAPTPGDPNVLNSPPWIRGLTYSPIPPMQDEDTIISAYVTDGGTVDSVMVYYNVEETGWNRVVATTGDSLYIGAIPSAALTDFDIVEYFMRAVDDNGAVINYPAGGKNDPYRYRVGITPINLVQFEKAGGDTSQLLWEPVNVQGVVTMATDVVRDDMFFIQDEGGASHGIACYMPGIPTQVQEGELVTVSGYVAEYYGQTQVVRHFTESMDIISPGNSLVYTDVSCADVDSTDAGSEQYEGVLVTIDDLTVTQGDNVPGFFGNWLVRDGSGVDVLVDNDAYYTYDPEVLDEISELRGIVTFAYDYYRLQPRYDEDIIGPPRISDVRYAPVPPSDSSATTVSAVMTDDVGVTGSTLYWSYSKARPYGNAVTMTENSRYENTWTCQIPAQIDGARVYYYVECTDGTMDAERPSFDGYSYYTGVKSIEDVQQVPPGGDASPMDSLAVNVEGYVMAEPGVFTDNTFYIQDADGAWDGILVYDRNGLVDFERGDYVVCCGEVDEYFGQTQIQLHFTEAAQLAPPPPARTDPFDPVSIPTGLLQNGISAEQYESVYVLAEYCTVIDENVGIGEWLISNGAPEDTCRVDNFADYTYVPANGDEVSVKGVVTYAFSLWMLEPRGNEDIATIAAGVPDDQFGGKFGLAQNAPNPFNPKTTIAFSIAKATDVTLGIYEVTGRKVATLIDRRMDAGPHQAHWNGMTSDGERAASGVYFYKLTAGDEEVSRKMVLLK